MHILKPKPARVLALDIEASNLSADFGIILTFGSKQVGKGKAKVLNILDFLEDAGGDLIKAEGLLLERVSRVMLEEADIWLTHFGTYYDILFIQTRLLYHKLPTLPPTFPHVDTWKIAKNRLKLSRNRLVTISEFLGTEEEKNAIKPEQWVRALGGHRKSMDYIVEHNRRDVGVLEEVYLRLRALDVNHPVLLVERDACAVCGEKQLRKRLPHHRTRTRIYERFQCRNCGAWHRGQKPIAKVAG